jgi:hypothetical protein
MVTTNNIEVHRAGAAEDKGWTTVVGEEKTFDLIAIAGAEVFLGDKEVAAGRYTQIRLDVTRVVVTLEEKEIEAKLPSDKLKVVRPWEVVAGETTILTLDFEADKFVVITGKGKALVKPVLKLEVSKGEKPLKTPAAPEAKPTPGATPAATPEATPTATPTPAAGPPQIPHSLQGRDNCLLCHEQGIGGAPQIPTDHAGRTNETCQACHQPSGG